MIFYYQRIVVVVDGGSVRASACCSTVSHCSVKTAPAHACRQLAFACLFGLALARTQQLVGLCGRAACVASQRLTGTRGDALV
jgi:hypothetical protein